MKPDLAEELLPGWLRAVAVVTVRFGWKHNHTVWIDWYPYTLLTTAGAERVVAPAVAAAELGRRAPGPAAGGV